MSEHSLRLAVMRADARGVATMERTLGPAQWSELVASTVDARSSQTVVHLALHAEFGAVSELTLSGAARDFQQLLARRQRILKALTRAGEPAISRWCPLVDAVHFRLLDSMRLLISSLSTHVLRECLTERDVYGQTVLHATAAAKAPGIARRLLLGGDAESFAIIGRHVGVKLPLPEGGALPGVSTLNEAIATTDLELLLDAGIQRAGLRPSVWLDARDGRGLSPLHHACRAGRASAVSALLAAGADPLLRETEWLGSCGHTSAARGHVRALEVCIRAGGTMPHACHV